MISMNFKKIGSSFPECKILKNLKIGRAAKKIWRICCEMAVAMQDSNKFSIKT